MAKVKLTKTGEGTITVYGTFPVDRVEKTYAVEADGKYIGYVHLRWGVDYPGSRAKVQSFWQSYDAEGTYLDWTDYRVDAVKAVARAAGVAV